MDLNSDTITAERTDKADVSAIERQVDGKHYKGVRKDLQPIAIAHTYNLSPSAAFALKHLLRYRNKGEALTDIKKAIHYLEMLIEFEQLEDDPAS